VTRLSASTRTKKSGAINGGAPKLQFSLLSVQPDPGLLNGRLHPFALCFDLLFAFFNRLGSSILAIPSLATSFR